MKRVRVPYFAMLREQAQRDEELVETAAGTPAALYDELAGRHGFTLPAAHVKVALNGEIAPWDTPLQDGSRLVFIPPFAGG
jgi:molybdopterin converting factor small subunit